MAFLTGLIGRITGARAPAGEPQVAPLPSLASEARGRYERGVQALQQGDARSALELLQQCIALRTRNDDFLADAQLQIARAASRLGDGAQVVENLQALLTARRDDAELLAEATRLLHDCSRYPEALDCAQRLVALQPTAPAPRVLLAQEEHFCGFGADALRNLGQVLATDPTHADALRGRSQILLQLGRAEAALQDCDQVLALVGETATGLANRAAVLQRLGRNEEALRDLERALELAPGDRRLLVNRINVLMDLLRLQEAKAAAQDALRLHPEAPELHVNLGLVHLLLGELAVGWTEREWRWRVPAFAKQARWGGAPWSGEDLAGRTLLLFAEQGFGDTIQLLRYLPPLAQQAGRVLLDLPSGLAGLLRDLPANCRVLRAGEPQPEYDFQCAFMSVPRIVGTTLDSIPAPARYLQSDPVAARAWAKRLGDANGRRTVGLVWSGNPGHVNDHNRSMPLQLLRPLAQTNCRFVSLQPEVRDGDQAAYGAWPGLLRLGEQVQDFADTAALIDALDLVVTVDTSVAHLAGALGKPVWILLPYAPDWRWLLEREDSPWYPSARLLRQPATGDWAPVIERLARDLAAPTLPVAAKSATSGKDWIARGNAALQAWDLAQAAECYRHAMLADPADPLACLNRGFVALERGDSAQAIALLTQALSLGLDGSAVADAQFLLGRARRQQGDVPQALAAFEAAVAAKPDFAEPMEEAILLLQEQNRAQDALAWSDRLQKVRQSRRNEVG